MSIMKEINRLTSELKSLQKKSDLTKFENVQEMHKEINRRYTGKVPVKYLTHVDWWYPIFEYTSSKDRLYRIVVTYYDLELKIQRKKLDGWKEFDELFGTSFSKKFPIYDDFRNFILSINPDCRIEQSDYDVS